MPAGTNWFSYLFARHAGPRHGWVARWLFLRALGCIYFSVFFSLLFQLRGLIGTYGILPAGPYLADLHAGGLLRYWVAPTLLWLSPGNGMLMALTWAGLAASLLVALNILPRWSLVVCFVCFLSFVGASQDFGQYQSDGMLLEAGLLAIFAAPAGLLPGWGRRSPAPRAAILLLLWEWFRIYFESGIVKLQSGDPTWRNLTAMYEYYQNGPLPTWIGWYLQHLPHWFQIATAGLTLGMELLLVFLVFCGRRARIACFFIVTVWQIGVIATANYAFLNYLVLVLAVLLLDDAAVHRFVPRRWRPQLTGESPQPKSSTRVRRVLDAAATAILLAWIGYATTAELVVLLWPAAPMPMGPVALLEPFRVANSYGLFATMTPHRYEIEFQGSNDGTTWTPYPFRYKPQDPHHRPRIYAPYQPRFDWNLWFASLGPWQQASIVPLTQERLLTGDRDVLGLFAGDPFAGHPPRLVRTVLWQYWFSTPQQKRAEGVWWRRELLGTYSPTVERAPDGSFTLTEDPQLNGPPEP